MIVNPNVKNIVNVSSKVNMCMMKWNGSFYLMWMQRIWF